MAYPIVASDRDNAAVGRSLAASVTGVALVVGLTVARYVMGVPVPITDPPVVPGPVVSGGGDHQNGGGHRLLVPADANGSCYVAASVNGATFNHMLLDTGASGHLTFGRNHAARLGLDPDQLSYNSTYGSANGEGHEAVVTLREFRLGGFVLHDVPAMITEKALFAPLVGIEILHRLDLRLNGGHCELRLPS